ncbi:MAG: hypothetical protein JMDDDDMK_02068 [Acidobacteria bacterium]|nr:hypothetical protein [Acidobacteriota bacterium]
MQSKSISLYALLARTAITIVIFAAFTVDHSASQKSNAATKSTNLITTLAAPSRSASQDPVRSAIVKILNNRTLFGKDFPTALAFLSSWNQISERQVEFYPDRVVGSTRYTTLDAAQQAAGALRQAVAGPQPKPSPEFADLLKGVPTQFPFRVDVIPFFPDDGSIRVAWVAPPSAPGVSRGFSDPAQTAPQFFDPGLTAATVRQEVGSADEVTQQVLQTDKEERPVTLTAYSYAKGALVFAEADVSPRPGFIDRINFNVPVVTSVVFVASGPSVK